MKFRPNEQPCEQIVRALAADNADEGYRDMLVGMLYDLRRQGARRIVIRVCGCGRPFYRGLVPSRIRCDRHLQKRRARNATGRGTSGQPAEARTLVPAADNADTYERLATAS